jgi:hypothetical protein
MAKILKVDSIQVSPDSTGAFVDNDYIVIQRDGQDDLLKIPKSGILPTLPQTGFILGEDYIIVGDAATNSLKKITRTDIIIGTDLQEIWLRT